MQEHSYYFIWVLSMVFEERLSKDDAAKRARCIGMNIVIITPFEQDLAGRETGLPACPIDGVKDGLSILW